MIFRAHNHKHQENYAVVTISKHENNFGKPHHIANAKMVSRTSTDRRPPRGPAAMRRRGDRDGDVAMDSVAVKGRSKIGKAPPTGPAAARATRSGGKDIIATGARREIIRKAAGDVSMKETRAPSQPVTFRVDGWTKSKAADSPDGGRKSLTEWLQKKAGMRLGRKDVRIRKV